MPWETARKTSAYSSAEYRRKRLACLRAAQWRCQIRLEGCRGAASEVDHIDQLANDPHHNRLRAACTSCHRKVTAQQGRGFRASLAADPEHTPRTVW
jgi:5-methylcytosine-specific restriction endonuclease McrA